MNLRTGRLIGLGACCVFALGSCETNPTAAFPPAHALAATVGAGQNADVATLDRGRKIYTTSCTECHVARPIAQHSVEEWRHFIAIMAPRAALQPADRAALEAYVIAARRSLSPSSALSAH
jgi:mono/diheme cytochrome c family protein